MLNQSFSSDNFRKIFDIENRKGNYLEGKYFPEIEKLSQEVQGCANELRTLRQKKQSYTDEKYEELKAVSLQQLKKFKEMRETELVKKLEEVSKEVCSKNFSFGISELNIGQPKKVYIADQTAATFFALKQIQFNIRRLYKVKQSNRHQLICQLRELLGDKLPKYIIRTDISSFYESIPRSELLKKLSDDPLLTLQSKKLIRRILFEYSQLTGSDVGLPRGIGISAYLAELYMREIDDIIRNYPGVLFYARYVDDIVVIFCPPPNVGTLKFRQLIVKAFSRLRLKRNRSKTKIITVGAGTAFELTYLGYKFTVGGNTVKLSMSDAKVARYKKRLDLAFSTYKKKSMTSEINARRLLEKRIDFLTGNTRLVNNKKNVVSGIYFSNSLLTCFQDLKAIDFYLQSKVSKLPSGRLKARLQTRSFEYGFETRRYRKFSAKNLSEIVGVWKHVS